MVRFRWIIVNILRNNNNNNNNNNNKRARAGKNLQVPWGWGKWRHTTSKNERKIETGI